MNKILTFSDGSIYVQRPGSRWGIVNMSNDPFLVSGENEVCYIPINDWATPPDRPAKGSTIQISRRWLTYLDNFHIPAASNWLWTPFMLWINRRFNGDAMGSTNADPEPVTECITGTGNLHRIIGETPTHYEVWSLSTEYEPALFNPYQFNWYNYPWIFWKAQARTRNNVIQNVGSGLDVYHLHLRKPNTRHFIHKSQLTLLRAAPFDVNKDGSIYTIVDYQFLGASIYGITDKDDRIPLLLRRSPSEEIYPTDWKIGTPTVIPPVWKM
jgi:hypothetical protein